MKKNMQINFTFQPKTVAPPQPATRAARSIPSASKKEKLQPGTLTREELRQIIIDMIG